MLHVLLPENILGSLSSKLQNRNQSSKDFLQKINNVGQTVSIQAYHLAL